MCSDFSVVSPDLLGNLDVRQLEVGSGTVRQVTEKEPVGYPVVFIDDNDIGVFVFHSLSHNRSEH